MDDRAANAAPAATRLRGDPDGRVRVVRADGTAVEVTVTRCFPWLSPRGWVSLRDKEGEEVALVRDAAELDEESRRVLDRELALAGFAFEIAGITAIRPHFEIRVWEVVTASGARKFATELDAWPEPMPDGGMVIRDVGGDLYRIPAPDRLDPATQRELWAFLG